MKPIYYNQIRFLKSAASLATLPPDMGREVAFVGRSNSGKSSAINTITGVSRLARASKTPGRTQLINFFEFDEGRRLVDLPGYGYAKATDAARLQWQEMIEDYLGHRESLAGLILLMDIRHPLKDLDWQMITWAISDGLPVHILLTKADKLKRGAAKNAYLGVQRELSGYDDHVTVQLFSAFSGIGIEEVKQILEAWLNGDSDNITDILEHSDLP